MKQIWDELEPLAEKYESTLDIIGEKAETMRDTWKEEMAEIAEAWKEKYADELDEAKNARQGRHFNGRMGGFGKMGQFGQCDFSNDRAVARFMLWDGTMRERRFRDAEDNQPESIIMGAEDSEFDQSFRNYPNPFSDRTTIFFALPKLQKVSLEVYDNLGKKVGVLFEGELNEGEHSFIFNASSGNYKDIPAGTYIYKLTTESFTKTGKMILSR